MTNTRSDRKNSSTSTTVPAAEDIQRWIATKVAKELQVNTEGVDVNLRFSELGLDSTALFTVTGDLSEWLDRDLEAELFWKYPTILAVAEHLAKDLTTERGSDDDATISPPLVRVSRDQDLALSFGQERQYGLEQLNPGSSAINTCSAKTLKGPLDLGALQKSFTEIVNRHESLRTTFQWGDSKPIQIVHPTCDVNVSLEDLRQIPEEEREAECQRLSSQHLERSFDLERGPLIRMVLIKMGDEEHVLLLAIHHIVFDGWSFSVFYEELRALYQAFIKGLPSPLPELQIQYADFAHWQRETLNGEVLEQQLAYWRNKLSGSTPLRLPTDQPHPMIFNYQAAQLPFRLSEKLTSGLKNLAKEQDASLFTVLATLFNVLLHRYSGQDDISLGTFVSNRARFETQRLIGFFVNNLVLRNDLSGDPSFREALGRVGHDVSDSLAHQDVPFETLLRELRPPRDGVSTPFFQVLLAFHNFPSPPVRLENIAVSNYEASRILRCDFELVIWVWEEENELSGYFEYASNLFSEETMSRMETDFIALVESVVEDSEENISSYVLPFGPRKR